MDENNPYIDDKPKYEKDYDKGEYVIVNKWKNAKQNYNSDHASYLPRMWSGEHAENYMMFSGLLDFKIKPEYQMENELRKIVSEFRNEVSRGKIDYQGYSDFLKEFGRDYLDVEKPSFGDNLYYMIDYQFRYMYWRYFMWNFQDARMTSKENMMTYTEIGLVALVPIDELHLGMSQDNLPSDVANNKARNTYYMLPLILGLVGFLFLLAKDPKRFG